MGMGIDPAGHDQAAGGVDDPCPFGERRHQLRAGSGDGHDPFVLHQDLGGLGAGRPDDRPSGDQRAHLGLLCVDGWTSGVDSWTSGAQGWTSGAQGWTSGVQGWTSGV